MYNRPAVLSKEGSKNNCNGRDTCSNNGRNVLIRETTHVANHSWLILLFVRYYQISCRPHKCSIFRFKNREIVSLAFNARRFCLESLWLNKWESIMLQVNECVTESNSSLLAKLIGDRYPSYDRECP